MDGELVKVKEGELKGTRLRYGVPQEEIFLPEGDYIKFDKYYFVAWEVQPGKWSHSTKHSYEVKL